MIPIVAFFQPPANFPTLAAMGFNTVAGPEPTGADQKVFASQAAAAGLNVILKNPVAPLPPNCVGMLMTVDEPNEPKGNNPPIPASALKANFDALRALHPTMPIYLTIGGDRLLYNGFPNAADRALLLGYAALGDITFAVDFYPANRSSKYPMSYPAEAVANLGALTGRKVHAILEANDQNLGAPTGPGETNGAPTPKQIEDQFHLATAVADGIWYFFTCPNMPNIGWPQKYMPAIDRHGISMQPQYDAVKACCLSLNPPPAPTPTLEQRITAVEAKLAAMGKALA